MLVTVIQMVLMLTFPYLGKEMYAVQSSLGNTLFREAGKNSVKLDSDICTENLANASKWS